MTQKAFIYSVDQENLNSLWIKGKRTCKEIFWEQPVVFMTHGHFISASAAPFRLSHFHSSSLFVFRYLITLEPRNGILSNVIREFKGKLDSLKFLFLLPPWRNSPTPARVASLLRFVDHTRQHTTVGRTPLDG
jgi:hypothetical protein